MLNIHSTYRLLYKNIIFVLVRKKYNKRVKSKILLDIEFLMYNNLYAVYRSKKWYMYVINAVLVMIFSKV